MIMYLGDFVALIAFGFFIDNFGRRWAFILTETVSIIGFLIICSSFNLVMALFGCFIAGAGSSVAIRIGMVIITEIT